MAAEKLVLVVEDDADTRESMRRLLESSGFAVVCAANGEIAMDRIADMQRPDVILLDLTMPVMDGWELCQFLDRYAVLASIPVIIISAQGDLPQTAASLSAADYFRKPFEPERLLQRLRAFT